MMTAMEFDEAFRRLAGTVREKLERASGCHDFDHTLRVLRNAELLAKELPAADLRIVRLAALLHDFARPEEMAAKGKLCHAVLGAELVRPLLAEAGFEPETVDRVSQAVLTHRYRANRIPATLEAQIVYDADKLDSLGAVGSAALSCLPDVSTRGSITPARRRSVPRSTAARIPPTGNIW